MNSMTPVPPATLNLDAEALYLQLLVQIKEHTSAIENLAIVGIYSGGVWLAERR